MINLPGLLDCCCDAPAAGAGRLHSPFQAAAATIAVRLLLGGVATAASKLPLTLCRGLNKNGVTLGGCLLSPTLAAYGE